MMDGEKYAIVKPIVENCLSKEMLRQTMLQLQGSLLPETSVRHKSAICSLFYIHCLIQTVSRVFSCNNSQYHILNYILKQFSNTIIANFSQNSLYFSLSISLSLSHYNSLPLSLPLPLPLPPSWLCIKTTDSPPHLQGKHLAQVNKVWWETINNAEEQVGTSRWSAQIMCSLFCLMRGLVVTKIEGVFMSFFKTPVLFHF